MEVLGLTAESYLRKEWSWFRHEEKLQRLCWAFSYRVSCRHCTYIYRRRTHLERRKQYRCAHLLNFIKSKGREVRARRPQWDWAGGETLHTSMVGHGELYTPCGHDSHVTTTIHGAADIESHLHALVTRAATRQAWHQMNVSTRGRLQCAKSPGAVNHLSSVVLLLLSALGTAFHLCTLVDTSTSVFWRAEDLVSPWIYFFFHTFSLFDANFSINKIKHKRLTRSMTTGKKEISLIFTDIINPKV